MTPNRSVASEEENRAVSPVVGVAILVGITVILASVVGAFVFGLVSIGESSPDASFTFSQETSNFTTSNDIADSDPEMKTVRVTHNSGEAVQISQLIAKVSGNKSDPQSNESVYQIDYQGDQSDDEWKLVLNDTNTKRSVFKPGNSFVIGFYGVSRSNIGNQITDYNVTNNNPPSDELAFNSGPNGQKLGECDLVEIVWRSDSGAQGQVLQTYQLPGTECA